MLIDSLNSRTTYIASSIKASAQMRLHEQLDYHRLWPLSGRGSTLSNDKTIEVDSHKILEMNMSVV